MAAACRSCRAPILWAITNAGRRMPLNAQPDPDGLLITWTNNSGELRVSALATGETTGRPHYTSHFATCSSADAHRRPR